MNRFAISALLICLLLIFVGCADTADVPETDFDAPATSAPEPDMSEISLADVEWSDARVMLSESRHKGTSAFALNKLMDSTTIDGITYRFERGITDDIRADCINSTARIVRCARVDCAVEICVYLPETYSGTFISEGVIYTCVQDFESIEYTAILFSGIFGEYANYGALYGYANYLLCELYGREMPLMHEKYEYDGGIDSLDMNLLCFDGTFVKKDSKEIPRIANTFVSEYINALGEAALHSLIRSSADPHTASEFSEALRAFYLSRGIEYTPSEILYSMGGVSCDYVARCKYAEIYVERDWVDANGWLNPVVYDGFLHKNYSDVKKYFTTAESEMGSYRELFAIGNYNDDLEIHYTSESMSNTSWYNGGTHNIQVMNVASFMHEYIHSLTYASSMKEGWAVEGLAECYDSRFNSYGTPMTSLDHNTPEKYTDTQTAQMMICVNEFREKLGRDIDTSVDWAELMHIKSWSYGYQTPNGGSGYVPGASFVAYLCGRFGERETLDMLFYTHDFFGSTYEELTADWLDFLEENYSEYTRIRP